MALTKVGKEGVVGLDNSADATAITITSAENVGIGTASPTALSNYTSVVANNSTGSMFELMVGGTRTANMQTSASAMNIQTRTSIPMIFDTNSTEAMKIDANGHVTLAKQPSFLARPASTIENLPINTNTTVTFGTETFDRNADYNNSNYTFTAPIEGLYQLSTTIYLQSLDHDTSYYGVDLITSNRTFYAITSMSGYDADVAYFSFHISALADMDANDTALVKISIPNSGAAQADISTGSHFTGYLVC